MLSWITATLFCFMRTEWAERNPALFVLLMMPTYCLINSKMIVSNFTAMEIEALTFNCFNCMLFHVNRDMFGEVFSEGVCALIIFSIDLGIYLVFVFCTIGQITKFLDIYCLSIK